MPNSGNAEDDADGALDATRARLDDYVRGARSYQCAAVLRATGELVGAGGVRANTSGAGDGLKLFFGWPELGYGIARAHWGKGLATEFLGAWAALYFSAADVSREEVVVEVDARTVPGADRIGFVLTTFAS